MSTNAPLSQSCSLRSSISNLCGFERRESICHRVE
jgi:hypothetical protein